MKGTAEQGPRSSFTRHRAPGVCSPFKSRDPKASGPASAQKRVEPPHLDRCGQTRQKGRLALPGVRIASSSYQNGGSNSNSNRCSKGTPRAADRKKPVPSQRPSDSGSRRPKSRPSLRLTMRTLWRQLIKYSPDLYGRKPGGMQAPVAKMDQRPISPLPQDRSLSGGQWVSGRSLLCVRPTLQYGRSKT